MKCPLLDPIEITTGEGTSYRGGDCLKEDCAWWSTAIEQCAVLVAVTGIVELGCQFLQIKEKMPHVGQFKR